MSFIVDTVADARVYDSLNFGLGAISLYEDSVITDSGALYSDNIRVTESITLENHGLINGKIYIGDGHKLVLQNAGDIDAEFHFGNNSGLVQLVRTNDDMTDLGLDGGFDVLVRDSVPLLLRDIYSLSGDNLILDNATLILDGVLETGDRSLAIMGNVFVHLGDVSDVGVRPILRNITGDGKVYFITDDLPVLYAIESYVVDGDVYARMVRETDYVKVLKNDVGRFLNELRLINPDDGLLVRLDAATTMDEINSVMADSVRLNPINLMRPIRSFNLFRMNFDDMGPGNLDVRMGYVASDDFEIYSAGATGMLHVGNDLTIRFGGGVGDVSYVDDINDYSGLMLGGDIRLRYDNNFIMADIGAGATYAMFDVGPVYDNGAVKINPDGVSVYGSADFGVYAIRSGGFSLMPFVGVGTDYVSVLDDTDFDTTGRIGAEFNFASHEYSLHYDYRVRAFVDSGSNYGGGVRMAIWSPYDDMGGNVDVDIIYGDIGLSYRVSLNGCVKF